MAPKLRLYNTLNRQLEEFEPIEDGAGPPLHLRSDDL